MKPSVSAVKKLRPFGWADFKHKLYKAGVLGSPTKECPVAWQRAFCKYFNREFPLK